MMNLYVMERIYDRHARLLSHAHPHARPGPMAWAESLCVSVVVGAVFMCVCTELSHYNSRSAAPTMGQVSRQLQQRA